MPELGTAYVQVLPSTKGISGSISSALGGESAKAGKSAGLNIVGAIKDVIAAAGIGSAIKATLEAGGALQQSFGGLDTLYGEASEAAKQYAMAAAQAGISANDYAEQAVSFGASLKQAFGGDTLKAAEAANTAIMDMADNSAKMGTDITAVQSAYQGFAKQNYTMLDNLKLGYGGTKTEMERLLKDAQKLSGVKYDINNLGDVYQAIHVIQEDLGLTGVAAQEASETFTGSLGAMKASLQNVMAGLALGQDIGPALDSLGNAVSGFLFNNLFPMIGNILKQLPDVLSGAISMAIQALNLANLDMSGIVEMGTDLITKLADSIVMGLPSLIESAWNLLTSLGEALISFDWIGWAQTTISTLSNSFSISFSEIGVPTTIEGAIEMVQGFISGWSDKLPEMWGQAAELVAGVAATIGEHLPEILQKGIELVGELASGLIQAIPDLVGKIPEIFTAIKDAFSGYDWKQIGSDILAGIGAGIKGAVDGLVGSVTSAASEMLGGVKSFFKIGSPSKLMAQEIGRWIPAGIAMGIEGNLGVLDSAISDMDAAINPTANAVSGVNYRAGEAYNAADDLNRVLHSNSDVNVTVVLQGDAQKFFKVVRKEDNKFKTSTGKSAFNY